jgi:hypothetical protein
MMMVQAQPTLRTYPLATRGRSTLDPAELGATLRELAFQAHRLIRATDGLGSIPDRLERELTAVRARIVRMQRNLGSHRLDDLARYVSALRKRVEGCLV